MGVGKTTVSQQLKKTLRNSVFLDGDWCWDADPFQVTEETKKMVMQNIFFVKFLHIVSLSFLQQDSTLAMNCSICASSKGATESLSCAPS